jgi:hypothetical protein
MVDYLGIYYFFGLIKKKAVAYLALENIGGDPKRMGGLPNTNV